MTASDIPAPRVSAPRAAVAAAGRLLAGAPLLVNGYALVASAGVSSALGFVFWIVATRLYTPEQVGIGAALISTMMTIGYFAQVNLGAVLHRFLPTAGQDAGRLIAKSYLIAGSLAVLIGAGFAAGIGSVAAPLQVLRDSPGAMALYVTAAAVWTVFALQDAALAGLRKSVLVPIENTIYAAAKIAAVAGFALLAMPAPGGIYFAWTLPLVPVVLAINWIIFARLLPERPDVGRAPDLKTVTRFLGWDYAGSLALAGAYGLAPLVVLTVAGAAANASFHLAWTFAYSIYLVGRSMSISLVAEGAADPARLRTLTADTICHAGVLVTGAVGAVLIGAPLLMMLFGPAYAVEGTTTLRVLAIACLPWTLTTIYAAVARARGRTFSVAVVHGAALVLFAGGALALVDAYGPAGVAAAWLGAQSLVVTGIAVHSLATGGKTFFADAVLAIAASAARTAASARAMIVPAKRGGSPALPEIPDFIHDANVPLVPVPVAVSLSDSAVFRLTHADGPHTGKSAAVLKTARTPAGRGSLQRNADTLVAISSDPRLRGYRERLPALLGVERIGETLTTVETALTGTDGRAVLAGRPSADAAFASAISMLADLHRQTALPGQIDRSWVGHWIDTPVENAAAAATTPLLSRRRRREALADLAGILTREFTGSEDRLGLGHGDYSPGNILFGGRSNTDVTGIVDWDTARSDAPAGLDARHLALTTRALRTGEELGGTLLSVLKHGWTDDEAAVLAAAGIAFEGDRDRTLTLLAWLSHLGANVAKSKRYGTSRLWLAANLDRVLIELPALLTETDR